MTEPSDFLNWSDSHEPAPPQEPFDPVEHFESLGEAHLEPVENELDQVSFEDDVAEPPSSPTSVKTPVSHSLNEPSHPSHIRGVALALVVGSLLIGLGVLGTRPLNPSAAPTDTKPTDTKPTDTKTAEEKPAAATTVADTKGTEAPAAAVANVEAVKSVTDGISQRVDELQKQLASLPKPLPAPDLKPLEAKIEGLAKRVEASPATPADTKGLEEKIEKATSGQADLTEKLNTVTTQLGNFEKALAAEKSEVAMLQAKIKSLSEAKPKPESVPSAAVATTVPAASADTEAEFSKAVEQFKKLQFAQAKDLFTKLQESTPNDARVWYYSAMTNGFVSTQWTGETVRLVRKGMELEKAGTPDTAKINAAVADLPVSTKGWLDAYRAQIIR